MTDTDYSYLLNDVNRENAPELQGGMDVHINAKTKLTAGELRGVANANPDHPCSCIFRKAVRKMTDDAIVIVDKADLEGVIKDCYVCYEAKTVKGVVQRTKKVGKKRVADKSAPTKTAKKKASSGSSSSSSS